jgi:hypothetical protein
VSAAHLPANGLRTLIPVQFPVAQNAFCVQHSVVFAGQVMLEHPRPTFAGTDDQSVAGQLFARQVDWQHSAVFDAHVSAAHLPLNVLRTLMPEHLFAAQVACCVQQYVVFAGQVMVEHARPTFAATDDQSAAGQLFDRQVDRQHSFVFF